MLGPPPPPEKFWNRSEDLKGATVSVSPFTILTHPSSSIPWFCHRCKNRKFEKFVLDTREVVSFDGTEHSSQRLEQRPWLVSWPEQLEERGGGSRFVLWRKLKRACRTPGISREAQTELSIVSDGIKHLNATWCEVIIMQWQAMPDLCFMESGQCHRQIAGSLLRI